MTCIVGITTPDGTVYIGGDSAAMAGNSVYQRTDAKVFRVGEFLIGCSGSFRQMQLIRYSFDPPTVTEDDARDLHRYMATKWVAALHDCLKAGGIEPDRDGIKATAGFMLVGVRGQLFKVESDYQVGQETTPYMAIGAGATVAYGAFAAQHLARCDNDATAKALIALIAAGDHTAGVREPFMVEKQEYVCAG